MSTVVKEIKVTVEIDGVETRTWAALSVDWRCIAAMLTIDRILHDRLAGDIEGNGTNAWRTLLMTDALHYAVGEAAEQIDAMPTKKALALLKGLEPAAQEVGNAK